MEAIELSRQLLEAASWRVVAELVRRHPTIRVIETHPGGDQYDCLQLLLAPSSDEDRPAICLLYTSPSPRDRTRSRMPSSA